MIAVGVWQQILDGIGWVLSRIYDIVPSYGIAIIILTILVRLVLLPLGIKQIRSMHAMQAVQPKIKAIQAKYKGNKQKAQEEIMKIYQEHGVNPLGGCLPLLLQMPVLIALYSVLRFPPPLPPTDGQTLSQTQLQAEMVDAMHIPAGSTLQNAILSQPQGRGVYFLGANLLCSASEAGKTVDKPVTRDGKNTWPLDCGSGVWSKIPIYFLILLMVGTTYFQQWQMQRASPPGAAQKQQQMITRVMPLMFLFFFWRYPSGMVLYWATSNLWQIGQQHFLLTAIKKEQVEIEKMGGKPIAPDKGRKKGSETKAAKPPKKGFMQKMMEQAEEQRKAQGQTKKQGRPKGDGGAKPRGDKRPGGDQKSQGKKKPDEPDPKEGQ